METRRVSEGHTDAVFSLAYASGFQSVQLLVFRPAKMPIDFRFRFWVSLT